MKQKYSLLLSAALLVLPALAPALAKAETVRPAVAKFLLQAETDLKGQKYTAALAEVNRAEAVGGLSPYETLVVAQLRGGAAAGAGQYELAARSYQTVLASGSTPAGETLPLLQAVAGFYSRAGDNAQTITWVNKYVAAGGTDAQTRALAVQADYTLGHYQAVVQDVKREGASASEPELQLAASAARKSGDNQAYFDALQALLKAHPSQAYWNQAIALVQTAPGFPDSLTLDVYRLRLATKTLNQPGDYEDYAERALLANHAAEAKRVLDAGFTSGTLTAQTDGGHAARLQALADKNSASPSVPPVMPLDQAIVSGKGFAGVPGYGQGRLIDATGALARLWGIASQAQERTASS
ncbi:MAG: hypothetical protein P4L52_04560 [Acidocella sp.]|nr:hypothetical protein [Acidocella sp.]